MEYWPIGSEQNITWDFPDVLSNVKIELSRNSGSTWEVIADSVANTGSYLWVVNGNSSNYALIKISGLIYENPIDGHIIDFTDITDVSDYVFTILVTTTPSPTITTTIAPTTTTTVAPTTTEPPSTITSKIYFSEVEVLKTKDNYHYIEWQVIPDPDIIESVDDYNFKIWYSRDPASGFVALPALINGATGPLSYTHSEFQYDFDQEHYYKIEIIAKSSSSKYKYSKIVSIGDNFSGYHDTMRYAESILYGYYAGEPSYILKKKVVGAHCTECWSPYRQQRIKTTCSTCNGSGFVGGYYNAITAQIAYDATPKKDDLTETSEDLTNIIQVRLSNYPIMRPKDIIINADDYKRYEVIRITLTKLPNLGIGATLYSKQNYVLSQILTVKEINASDPQYNINVPNLV